ncbi:porin family protein [Fulvivirga lutea]|uniref:Uncharacterized protein n=1 Tax=Fulvivirga lutea TaxID=2810512 RepID=A0A975A1Z6_9BACT|nr:hypothetical protein [Fulvivirga lutea]QSE98755.1 hypothetical protein JR347_06655 [Fulvivirga lutea]
MCQFKRLLMSLACSSFLLISTSAFSQDDPDAEFGVDEDDTEYTFDTDAMYALPNWYTIGDGLRFSSRTNDYSMRITGYIQPYYELFWGTDTLGNSYRENRYRISRARIKMSGESKKLKMSYRISFDLSRNNSEGDRNTLIDEENNFLWDAYITYRPFRYTRVSLGQKAPRTNYREFFMTSNTLQMVERSRITSLFSVFRDMGLFVDRRDKVYRDLYIKSYLEITTGEGQNAFENYGGLKYGGRLDIFPFGLFKGGEFNGVDMLREWKPKLVVGGAYSINKGMSNRNGNFRQVPDRFLYTDIEGNELLPDYEKFVADFLLKYRGFVVLGAYVKTQASVPSGITDDEATVRGRLNLGEIWNIQAGYLFRGDWSVDARYEKINDLIELDNTGAIIPESETFLDAGIYNRPEYYTFGLTKYMQKYAMKIQASITYNSVETKTGGDARIYSGANPSGGSDIDVAIPDEWTYRMVFSLAF